MYAMVKKNAKYMGGGCKFSIRPVFNFVRFAFGQEFSTSEHPCKHLSCCLTVPAWVGPGCFIVIDAMLERIKHEKTVDIYGHVTLMRAQRNYMVQDRRPVRLYSRRAPGGRHLRHHRGSRPKPVRLHPETHADRVRRERHRDGARV